jgi:ribonuclease P protein component
MNQRFRGHQRIRRRADYQQVYDHGRKAHGRYLTTFALPRQGSCTRLGIAATRKLGGAVDRNRAKRLLREIFRRNPAPPGLDIVVIPRRTLIDAAFSRLEADYLATLERVRPGRRVR